MIGERHGSVGSAQGLERHLSTALRQDVSVTVTDNRRTMISVRRRDGRLHVRVHHMFLHADGAIVSAIERYLRERCPDSAAVLDEHIRRHAHRIDRRRRRAPRIEAAGRHHDLGPLFDELNARWFEGAVDARVSWGRRSRPRRRPRRSIRLGAYDADQGLIRIHRALDQGWVPRFFVQYVLFHEMLHHALPSAAAGGGTRRIHTPQFRAAERAYPDYERAVRWERANLPRLLLS